MQVCLRVMMLSQLLIQGRMPETSTLCQLPHVDDRVAKAMQNDNHQPVHGAWYTIMSCIGWCQGKVQPFVRGHSSGKNE